MESLARGIAVRFIVPLLSTTALAVAGPTATLAATGDSATTAALATERYLASYADPHAAAPSTDRAALAAERYLSSYGTPSTAAPAAAQVASSDGPSWIAAILAGVGLATGAGLAGIAGGRATARPKRLSA